MDIRIVCTNGGVTFNVVKNDFSPWIGLIAFMQKIQQL
jgi:hypothetical protein